MSSAQGTETPVTVVGIVAPAAPTAAENTGQPQQVGTSAGPTATSTPQPYPTSSNVSYTQHDQQTQQPPPPPPRPMDYSGDYTTNNKNERGFFSFLDFSSRKTNTHHNLHQQNNNNNQAISSYEPMAGTSVPPPPSNTASNNPYASLPMGWSTAVDPQDGRIYYYEVATGQRSWHHPYAAMPPAQNMTNPNQTRGSTNNPHGYYTNDGINDRNMSMMMHADHNPRYAHSRPDNHQCSAVAALLLCFPLGLFAVYHSWQTDVAWKAGRYGDAVTHARQTPQYASWGIMIGSIYWILWFFFRRGNGEWDWPDFGNMFND